MIIAPSVAVIDDDDGIRTAIVGLLRSAGYEATPFSSAEAYLENPSRDGFDCVLTDIEMGQMDGLRLLEIIRSRDVRMPVLVMTAMAPVDLRNRAMEGGASCFLEKPFDAEALFGCLERVIPWKR